MAKLGLGEHVLSATPRAVIAGMKLADFDDIA